MADSVPCHQPNVPVSACKKKKATLILAQAALVMCLAARGTTAS